MKFYYYKGLNLICFEKNDLRDIFQQGKFSELLKELKRQKLSFTDLHGNKKLMDEITDVIVAKGNKRKEDIEIFSAIEYSLLFCTDKSKICFELKKGLNPHKLKIHSIDDLIHAIEEQTLMDFGIISDDSLKIFQLKQHKKKLDTHDVSETIEKALNKYGQDIGKTNLLIILQGKPIKDQTAPMNIDFEKLHKHLLTKRFKFTGQILIAYNENNKHQIINQVYPDLATSQREINQEYWDKWVDG